MMTYIDYKNVVPKAVIGLLVLMILLVPVITTNEATLSMLILSGIWAVAVMGFTLVLRTGQFSLGQAAFMAIGGYTSAILTAQMGWSFWPAFLLAGLVSGFVALLVGMVVLRVGGIYFSIITLALCEVIRIIAQQWESVTRGTRGLITSPPNPISLGFFEINFFSQYGALFLFNGWAGGCHRFDFLANR